MNAFKHKLAFMQSFNAIFKPPSPDIHRRKAIRSRKLHTEKHKSRRLINCRFFILRDNWMVFWALNCFGSFFSFSLSSTIFLLCSVVRFIINIFFHCDFNCRQHSVSSNIYKNWGRLLKQLLKVLHAMRVYLPLGTVLNAYYDSRIKNENGIEYWKRYGGRNVWTRADRLPANSFRQIIIFANSPTNFRFELCQ